MVSQIIVDEFKQSSIQFNHYNSTKDRWMIKSDDLSDILGWLSSRMNEFEKRLMLDDIGVKNIDELKAKWNDLDVKERVKVEVRKRYSVKDCTFKLENYYNSPRPTKTKFIPRTFLDMTSTDN